MQSQTEMSSQTPELYHRGSHSIDPPAAAASPTILRRRSTPNSLQHRLSSETSSGNCAARPRDQTISRGSDNSAAGDETRSPSDDSTTRAFPVDNNTLAEPNLNQGSRNRRPSPLVAQDDHPYNALRYEQGETERSKLLLQLIDAEKQRKLQLEAELFARRSQSTASLEATTIHSRKETDVKNNTVTNPGLQQTDHDPHPIPFFDGLEEPGGADERRSETHLGSLLPILTTVLVLIAVVLAPGCFGILLFGLDL